MLCAHPHIHVPPETHFFHRWDPLFFGGDPLPRGRLESYLDAWFASQNWIDQGLDRREVESLIHRGNLSARSIFLAIAQACSRQAGKPRIGEKTPIHSRHIPRIRSVFPEAKILHIYRDPRDVAASMLRMPWAHGTVRDFARRWVKIINEQLEAQGALPRDYYCAVQYESLVSNPSQHLMDICRFLGEPFDPAVLAHELSARAGFPVRFPEWQQLTTQPVTTKPIGRFMDDLSPRQIACVERIAGPLMDRFGYARVYRWRQYDPRWMVSDVSAHLSGRVRRWMRHLVQPAGSAVDR